MVSTQTTSDVEHRVWRALDDVMDPEIPTVSVVDMGMIERVEVDDHGLTRVVVLPTFSGCPAIAVIKEDVTAAVAGVSGIDGVQVETSFDPPWTSDRITARGRTRLKDFGLAPPHDGGTVLLSEIGLPRVATCPFCGSRNTRNDGLFGPTPCRAVYYCADCRNPFEQFKPV
jgi:ring-1,2-phenylacetyl-CoA epoxidase subunit PaaD